MAFISTIDPGWVREFSATKLECTDSHIAPSFPLEAPLRVSMPMSTTSACTAARPCLGLAKAFGCSTVLGLGTLKCHVGCMSYLCKSFFDEVSIIFQVIGLIFFTARKLIFVGCHMKWVPPKLARPLSCQLHEIEHQVHHPSHVSESYLESLRPAEGDGHHIRCQLSPATPVLLLR